MNGPLEWYAAISGIIAAAMIAWNHSSKTSGYGFCLFVTSSIAWVTAGITNGTAPLAIQNIILLLINLVGVYRYLIRGDKPAS